MKVFKFESDGYAYAVAAKTEQEARGYLDYLTSFNEPVTSSEIPESEWDNKTIEMHEDNDPETEAFFLSIRDIMCGEEPQLIYTNDDSLTD